MSLVAELQKVLGETKVEQGVVLSNRTSLRVGGKAELLALVETEKALSEALDVCVQHAAPYSVLGAGTNTLASDAGARGVVFRLGGKLVAEAGGAEGDSFWFRVAAGQPVTRVVALGRAKDCVGMEFLAGIPGTVGGGVAMNAGTRQGSFADVCVEIGLCEPGRTRTLTAEQVGFAYRRTALPEHAVVTWAKVRLKVGDIVETQRSRLKVEEDLAHRRRTQPLSLPNSGSIFRNPPGDYAGRLIQACGLKGKRSGGAQISEVHGNFVVNRGEATAKDVLALVRLAQDAVVEKFGVLLIPEIRLLGEFDSAELPRGLGLPKEPAA